MRTFAEIAAEVAELVKAKNAAYGEAHFKSAAILRLLFPAGVPVDRMHDLALIVRVLDKLCRIATDRDAFGEDPWRDINGYSLLKLRHGEQEREEAKLDAHGEAFLQEVLKHEGDRFASAVRRGGHYFAEAQKLKSQLERANELLRMHERPPLSLHADPPGSKVNGS